MSEADIPRSILIVGAGVFGLSTAYELATNEQYADTQITLIDRSEFPACDAASIDISRIVRADYSDPAYAALAVRAQNRWRADWGADNRYHETGYVLTAAKGKEAHLQASFDNVRALNSEHSNAAFAPAQNGQDTKEALASVQWLDGPAEIKKVTGCDGVSGDFGYVNWRSGWADAEATMRWLYGKVQETGRVKFLVGKVSRLLFSNDHKSVLGAHYSSTEGDNDTGHDIEADLTILATGGWTSTLLNMEGRLKATAQCLAYIPLSDDRAETMSKLPLQINISTGCFFMPPPPPSKHITFGGDNDSNRRLCIKIARHAPGYINPVTISHPEPHTLPSTSDANNNNDAQLTTSVPAPSKQKHQAIHTIPATAYATLQSYISTLFPSATQDPSPSSAPSWTPKLSPQHTRLCHYTDTPSSDFLIDYHPRYNNDENSKRRGGGGTLFIATGGSGHGFKFAPVLGECIVGCLQGKYPAVGCDGGAAFENRWRWERHEAIEGDWQIDDSMRGDGDFTNVLAEAIAG